MAWIAERKDVLSTFFGLLALWCYIRYTEYRTKQPGLETRPWVWYSDALVLFASSLMSKPMLVTLPFLFLLLDYWPLGRLELKTYSSKLNTLLPLLLEKGPFFLLAGAGSAIAYLVQESGGAVTPLEKLSFLARLENTPVAYRHYLQTFFWPSHLAVLYPHPGFWPGARVFAATLLVFACSLAAWFLRRKQPWLLVGWLWFLGTLVPVIGLVQIGVQAFADRYLYVPLIGLAVAAAWGIPELVARWQGRHWLLRLAAAAVLAALMLTTFCQVRYWRNSEALFSHALAATRNNAIAHNNLGVVLAQRGRFDQAVPHYLAALEINPDYTDAHNNLAFAYSEEQRWAEAIEQHTLALKRRPDAPAYANLGAIYASQGKWEQAIAECAKAIALNPNLAEAHYNWGLALNRLGRPDEGMQHYEAALRAQPDHLLAHGNLGTALLRQGRFDEARNHFLQVLRSQPDDLTALNNLGSTYLRASRYPEAVATYRQALGCHPESCQAHFNLGVALLRSGQAREAASEFESALRLKPDFAEAKEQLRILSTQASP